MLLICGGLQQAATSANGSMLIGVYEGGSHISLQGRASDMARSRRGTAVASAASGESPAS